MTDLGARAPDAGRPTRGSLLYDPKIRGLVFQALAVIGVLWLGYEVVTNTIANMQRLNIASGFGFLDNKAGFAIVQTLIPYNESSTYGRVFIVGLLNTLLVAAIGIVIATVLGFAIGIARLSSNWLISAIATVYIEVIRNLPLLLQIFFWYFAVLATLPSPRQSTELWFHSFLNNRGLFMPRPEFGPGSWLMFAGLLVAVVATIAVSRWARKRQEATGAQFPSGRVGLGLIVGLPLLGFLAAGMPISFDYPELKGFNFAGGIKVIPELGALLAALSTYTAAFIAENVRAGILSVSSGQTEAAYSLGLRRGATLRLVVIPQAMRVIIPPLTSQYLNLTKNSSLAVAIAYPDLVAVFAGTVLNQTGQAVEVLAMTMAVYLTLSILTALLMNWYNARKALVER